MFVFGGNQSVGGYEVANSLRFEDGNTDYLNKTFSSDTNRTTYTISVWIKRASVSDESFIIAADVSAGAGNTRDAIRFESNDRLRFFIGGASVADLQTSALFRDNSAWYHIIVAVDTTQSTASNRIKMYVNGNQVTDFSTSSYPSQNHVGDLNDNILHRIGMDTNNTNHGFSGYMAEFCFIDGQQLDETSFGEFDEDSGIWKPIDVSGLTFGTNGFYLDFENSSSLGADVSGNENNFTVNNLTSIDQTTDTPTNNYATLNALLPLHSSTFSEGNCKWTPSTASQYYWSNSTFGLSQGKWYMEAKLTTAADHNYIGIASDQPEDSTTYLAGGGGSGDANDAYQWGWKSSNGQVFNNASGSAYGSTYTTGDILGLYLDLDNNKLYFAKNGTVQNSGTGISITDPESVPGTGVYFPCVADGTSSNSSTWEVNFGNPTFTISSGNSDANGYGNFEHNPSSGTFDGSSKNFLAINSKNLAEYG